MRQGHWGHSRGTDLPDSSTNKYMTTLNVVEQKPSRVSVKETTISIISHKAKYKRTVTRTLYSRESICVIHAHSLATLTRGHKRTYQEWTKQWKYFGRWKPIFSLSETAVTESCNELCGIRQEWGLSTNSWLLWVSHPEQHYFTDGTTP